MQHLGIFALLLLLPLAVFISVRWPLKRHVSVSENIASNKSSQLLFSVGFTIVTILYYGFLIWWLGPHYGMSVVYNITLLIAFAAQLILTWVPARGKRKLRVHTGASYIVAIVMLVVVGLLIFSSPSPPSPFLFIICLLFLAMGAVMTFIYLLIPKARKDYLVYELVYFFSFWLVIILLTYL